jgi:membrane-bound inhibitor of C-type lysozyme
METKKQIGIVILLGVIIIVLTTIVFTRKPISPPNQTLLGKVSYACDGGKTIVASYFQGEVKVQLDTTMPPLPTGNVKLVLSDGRFITLPQTISADGARYSNADGSLVFWSKGKSLLFTEGNASTYSGCIQVADDVNNTPQVYENSSKKISIRYPVGYGVSETYTYQALGPNKTIGGIKFTIPSDVAIGTNLSSDSYLSVEETPDSTECSATLFLQKGVKVNMQTDNGTRYSVASSTGAGAGNRYEETVYAIPLTNPCVAIRYFVHYSVLENYPKGAVRAFDRQALIDQFDAIRRTLVVGQ